MNSYVENNNIVIELPNRIDADNSTKIGEEINNRLSDDPDITPEFDGSGLGYISSSGLRILLEISRRYKDKILIRDVSPEVYEIFDVTGFAGLFKVRKKLKTVSIEGCAEIGKGAFGTVYRLDREKIVKVYHEGISVDECEHELEITKKAFMMGIPTAIPFDMAIADGKYAALYELLDAGSMSKMLRDDPSAYDFCIDKYTELLKTIHSIHTSDEIFPSHTAEFRNKCHEISDRIPKKISGLFRDFYDGLADSDNLIHGDYHAENILLRENEALVIDLDTLGTGDPLFDISIAYMTTKAAPEGANVKFPGVPTETVHRFFDDFITSYYEGKTGREIENIIRKAGLISCVEGIYKMKDLTDNEQIGAIYNRLLNRLCSELELMKQ